MTKWRETYEYDSMTALFETEQEYIDAAYVLIVLYNFGVWIDSEDLLNEEIQFSG